jgi:hypothetical protein
VIAHPHSESGYTSTLSASSQAALSVIASQSEDEHNQHIKDLIQRLGDMSLVINREKCVFGVAAVEFLGHHHVTAAGTSPTGSIVS